MYIHTFVFCRKCAQQLQNYCELFHIAERPCDSVISFKIFQLASAFRTKLYLPKLSDNGTVYSIFLCRRKLFTFPSLKQKPGAGVHKTSVFMCLSTITGFTALKKELLCLWLTEITYKWMNESSIHIKRIKQRYSYELKSYSKEAVCIFCSFIFMAEC